MRQRPFKIHIPQICYGGNLASQYSLGIMRLMGDPGIVQGRSLHLYQVPFESLIPRARNYAASKLVSDPAGDALLFIDCDIEFAPQDVRALLEHMQRHGPCVVGGAYPKKWRSPTKMQKVAARGPDLPENLEDLVTEFASEVDVDSPNWVEKGRAVAVDHVATGFMLIHRDVLVTLTEATPPVDQYDNDIAGYREVPNDRFWDFFPTGVVNRKYLSEDYGFCRLVRERTPFPVHLLTGMTLTHYGSYAYRGNLQAQIDYFGKHD